ncbi:fibronectin type III domain-containing protein [Owenweeksia hongkongensis]|uniref:fibronectin type III domain-containing protein n=1 Tax=Owenweeksia hongkongensis TaxID=253245 RepID=UPI003A917B98
MLKYYLAYLFSVLLFSNSAFAQTTTIAMYSAGNISSDHFTGTTTTSLNSSCPGILNVPVPAGRYVTSIDVEYDFMALNNDWISEQSSYLECVTTSTKEASVTFGPPTNGNGTQSYSRNGISIANGLVPTGGLQFKLHAFRSFTGGGCSTTAQRIVNNSYKITVNHVAAPTCLPPSAVSVGSISANSANISWTTGGASNWQIEYGPVGFTPGSGTMLPMSTNPYTLSGLNPSTRYEFRLRDSCGLADVSFWTSIQSFRTSCAVTAAPWSEDFESVDWNTGTGFFGRGTIDTCFSRDYQGHFLMKVGPPQFLPFNSGPSGDHTTGSGQYLFSERIQFGTFPDTAYIVSPPIDLSPLTTPELSFWYHMFGPDVNLLEVFVSNNGGASYTSVFSKQGQQQMSSADAWKEAVVNLSSYANDTIQLKFISYQISAGTAGDLAIDDVDIHEQPSCPKPQNLVLLGTTSNSVSLQWQSGGASNWQIEYGSIGFAIGSGIKVNASSNPFIVSGLTASTDYDFYVRDSCGASDVSAWIGPISGKTACLPVGAPYTENFDGSQWTIATFPLAGSIDPCWSRDTLVNYQMTPMSNVITFGTGPSTDHTSGTGKFLAAQRFFGTVTQSNVGVVESPLIDLSALTIPELSFWYHMFGGDIDSLRVDIFDGQNWSRGGAIIGQQQTAKIDPWEEYILNMSAYSNDTVKLRFSFYRNSTFAFNSAISIDDVDIHEQPTCPKPQNLMLLGVTNSTASLQWTSGGAANWQIEYGPTGFTPGNGTKVNANANPFVLTGLSPNFIYDFYVRDSCGASDVSLWTGPMTGKTDCNPVSAPYTENFDGSQWTIGTLTVPGNIDQCWSRDETVNYQMTPVTTLTSFTTGANVDHTSGTGKFLAAQRFFGTLGQSMEGEVQSKLIDLSALTIPELTFWYHMFGVDIDSLRIDIFDGQSWSRGGAIIGSQQTAKTDPWEEYLVDISSYVNDTIKLKFTYYRNSTFAFNSAICIDDVDIHEQPTCPKPSNLSVSSTSSNSVTLSWTTGGATNWNIEYGTPGFTIGTGTRVTATTNPFVVTGLNSSTSYDFYVRDSCSATDTSFWVGPINTTTDCLPLLAPFTENFDGSPWAVGPNFNDTGSIGQCWARTPLSNYLWKPGPPIFPSTFTGPAADHTTGNGKYIYAESIFGGGTAPFDAFIESPLIDLSALTVPELTFWYHMFGTAIGNLTVEVDDGSGYTQVWTKSGQQQNSGTEAWKEAVISLAPYANDTIQIRFKADKASFNTQADAAIDDIDIHEAPSCPKPQDLLVVGTTNSTVTLQWTTGGATGWNIEYGSPGFTLGTGTIVNATTNPFTVTGLSASTGYEFYVRDSCGLADVSDWVGPVGDTTDCNPVTTPYLETFDGNSWVVPPSTFVAGNLDPCWDRDNTVNYVWGARQTVTTATTGPSADHTSGTGKFLYTHRTFGTVTQSNNGVVVSPLINTVPLNTPELSFWYHMFGADIDSLVLELYDGASWSQELTLSGQQQISKTDPWKEAIVDISAYANDTIKVRFTGYRNSTFAFNSVIAIDDLSVHEQPSCPKPSNLVATAATSNSVTLGWTTGGASNWQIEYGPSGFTQGAGTIVAAATNPFTINALLSSTTYDFYVRDSCGTADVSDWLGYVTKSTDCLPVLAPYSEDFEGVIWQSGPNFNDTGSVDQCWVRTPLTNYFWRTGPIPFPPTFTGPSGDHTTGSGKYVFAESVFGGGTAPFDAFLETPPIDLSSLAAPEMRFWYHMFGNGIGSMSVEVDNGTGFTQVWSKTGQQHTSNTDPWDEAVVSLASYINDTIVIRIKATKASFTTAADVAFDDLTIDEEPSCPEPQNLAVTTSTNTSITISWTTGGASNWLVGYRPSGTSVALTIVPASTNPFVINGLSPSSSYDIFIKDSCAAGDVSIWKGPEIGTTLCGVATAPWAENFDGSVWVEGTGLGNVGNQISNCWSRPSISNPNFGTGSGTTSSGGTGPLSDVSISGNYIYTEASGGASGAGEITTPFIYIPSSLQNPRFKYAYHMFGNSITSMTIQIDNGSGFGANVKTYTGQQQFSNAAAWLVDSIMLTAYSGDTVRFKFIGTNSGIAGDVCIDEVSVISDPVSCSAPAGISFTSVNATGFTVNWVSSANATVEVVESGQAQGSGTFYPNSNSPLVVSGLQGNTGYDVYIQDSCGVGNLSAWVSASRTTLTCPSIGASFANINSWLSVAFNSGSTTNADSLYWDFGDGSNSSAINPNHLYGMPGTYTVAMNAFSDCGDTTVVFDTIQVCDTLKADFSQTPIADSIRFDASASTNATFFKWKIDGTDTTGTSITFKFTSSGTKTVTLTAFNDCGDSVTVSKNVNACPPALASWTYNIISTTSAGMNVQFDGSASTNAVSYDWDFGDGNSGTGVNPQHTYITPSLTYLVRLTVKNACGTPHAKAFKLNEIGLTEIEVVKSIKVYPNPASDYLELIWSGSELVLKEVRINGISGKQLFKQNVLDDNSGKLSIDVSHLPAGQYIISADGTSGEFWQQKIIIE